MLRVVKRQMKRNSVLSCCFLYNKNTNYCRGQSSKLQREFPYYCRCVWYFSKPTADAVDLEKYQNIHCRHTESCISLKCRCGQHFKEERSMLTMDKVHFIRQLYYGQGKNIPTIIAETGYDRKTICKYIDMTDFNTPEPKVKDS